MAGGAGSGEGDLGRVTAPVVKWAGGKARLLPELLARLPGDYEARRHVELFAGGAALGLHVAGERSLMLGDVNPHLVGLYRALRDDCAALRRSLSQLARRESRAAYYRVRSRFCAGEGTGVQRAAMFLYLNRLCFNGLYRENAAGHFNVPFGDGRAGAYHPEALAAASDALQGCHLHAGDFEAARRRLRPGDFVYLDPPYVPTERTSFAAYAAAGFRHEDHIRLRDFVRQLSDRGVPVMVSNSDTLFVRDIYREFRIEQVTATRSIAASGAKRGAALELLIRNY